MNLLDITPEKSIIFEDGKVPIILFSKEYWNGLDNFILDILYKVK